MTFPTLDRNIIPEISTEQMIEVDRAMMENYGIELIQMMENAGRALAILARDRFLFAADNTKQVTILAGSGGNGGGALVAARRLASWGWQVQVCLTKDPSAFSSVPRHQLTILQEMNVPIRVGLPPEINSNVILDGIIGYSLTGAPTGVAAEMIRWADAQSAPILSLDTPSGLDAATGRAFDPSISATATLTLALPKAGLRHQQVGDLYLADISVPPHLYPKYLGLELGPIFAEGDILRLV